MPLDCVKSLLKVYTKAAPYGCSNPTSLLNSCITSSAKSVLSEMFLSVINVVWWEEIRSEETLTILSAKILVSNVY